MSSVGHEGSTSVISRWVMGCVNVSVFSLNWISERWSGTLFLTLVCVYVCHTEAVASNDPQNEGHMALVSEFCQMVLNYWYFEPLMAAWSVLLLRVRIIGVLLWTVYSLLLYDKASEASWATFVKGGLSSFWNSFIRRWKQEAHWEKANRGFLTGSAQVLRIVMMGHCQRSWVGLNTQEESYDMWRRSRGQNVTI